MHTITKNFLLIVILFMLGFQTVSAVPPTVEELRKGFRDFFLVKQIDNFEVQTCNFEVFLNLVLQYQVDLVKNEKGERDISIEAEYIFNFVNAFGFSFFGFSNTFIAVDFPKLLDFSSVYNFTTDVGLEEKFFKHFDVCKSRSLEEKFFKPFDIKSQVDKSPLFISIIYDFTYEEVFKFGNATFMYLINKFKENMKFLNLIPSDSKSYKKQKSDMSFDDFFGLNEDVLLAAKQTQQIPVIPDIDISSDDFFVLNEDVLLDAKSLQPIEEKLIFKYKTGKTVELIPNEKLPPDASYICTKCAKPVDDSFAIRNNGTKKVFECRNCKQKFSPNATIILDFTRIRKINSVSQFKCFCGDWHNVPALNAKCVGRFKCTYLGSDLDIYLRMKNKETGDDGFGYRNNLVTINFRILQEEEQIKKTKFLEFKCPHPDCDQKGIYDTNFDSKVFCKKCHRNYYKLPYTESDECPYCNSISFSLIGKVLSIYKCNTCGEKFYLRTSEKYFRDEVRAESRAEGRAEGEDRQRILNAKNLLDFTQDFNDIQRRTGLPENEVRIIYNFVVSNCTLDEAIQANEHPLPKPGVPTEARIRYIHSVLNS